METSARAFVNDAPVATLMLVEEGERESEVDAVVRSEVVSKICKTVFNEVGHVWQLLERLLQLNLNVSNTQKRLRDKPREVLSMRPTFNYDGRCGIHYS